MGGLTPARERPGRRGRRAAALGLASALVAASAADAAEVMHYVKTYHGWVIGVRRVAVREEGERIRTETLDHTRISARGVVVDTVTETVEITDIDGYGVELHERQTEGAAAEAVLGRGGRPLASRPRASRGSQIVELDVEVTADEVVFHTTLAGIKRPGRVARTAPVRFDLDGRAFARRGLLAVGRTVRGLVVARAEIGIASLEAEVVERVELPRIEGAYAGGEDGFLIRVSNAGGRGDPWEVVCDAEGRTVELRIGPMVLRRVAAADAVLPDEAPVLSNTFPTRRVTRPEDVRRMKVEAAVAGDVRADVFPDSAYSTAAPAEGGRFILSLTEARPDGRLPREELSEADRARFVAPSQFVESDAPEIVRLASRLVGGEAVPVDGDASAPEAPADGAGPRTDDGAAREAGEDQGSGRQSQEEGPALVALRVAGGEKEPLKRALFLTRWVHRNLRKRSEGPATASALEALRSGAGDCTEHAALVTALARAAELPARQAFGLVQDGEGFQFHAWAEAHVEDRWVPLDPTLGRVGVPALYVLLGREGDVIEYHCRANALQGRTSMRLVEVDRGDSGRPD